MFKIFIGVIISLFFIGISYLNTRMYAIGFKLNSLETQWLFFGFLLVPILLAISMILSQKGYISHLIYKVAVTVAGFGFYLFLGAVALLLVYGLGFLFKFNIPYYISLVGLILSLGLGVVGLIQARFIKLVNHELFLENLPEELNNKKIVLVSDTHFGLVNHKRFSEKVVNKIISLNPEFVLHGGDFYDGPKIDTLPLTLSWKKLASLYPTFMAPGNHEEYGDYKTFLTSIAQAGVIVLDDKKTTYKGINIIGVTFRENRGEKNITNLNAVDNALKALDIDHNKVNILINHTPTALKIAKENGVDLQVSGHTHRGQFWPLNYIIEYVYKEYAYGLNPYENMFVLTTSGVGTAGPPFRLFNTPELVEITLKNK